MSVLSTIRARAQEMLDHHWSAALAHTIAADVLVLCDIAEAAEELEAWASRMPDAGLTDDDPRRAWWFARPQSLRAALSRLGSPKGNSE